MCLLCGCGGEERICVAGDVGWGFGLGFDGGFGGAKTGEDGLRGLGGEERGCLEFAMGFEGVDWCC